MLKKNAFGLAIAKISNKYNISIEDLAKQLGISKQFLYFISTDFRSFPKNFGEKIDKLDITSKEKSELKHLIPKKVVFYSNNEKIINAFQNKNISDLKEVKLKC